MAVTVPNLIGLGRGPAEDALDALKLRHIAKFPFDGAGDGSAKAQSVPPGTSVPEFTVVTVSYPSPFGPMPDSGVAGPSLPSGTYEGQINGVSVGNPWGSGQGAWVEFTASIEGSPLNFTGTLYFDSNVADAPQPPRTEWMRRGAMLGVAQRAFTFGHNVRLVMMSDSFVQSIQIFKA